MHSICKRVSQHRRLHDEVVCLYPEVVPTCVHSSLFLSLKKERDISSSSQLFLPNYVQDGDFILFFPKKNNPELLNSSYCCFGCNFFFPLLLELHTVFCFMANCFLHFLLLLRLLLFATLYTVDTNWFVQNSPTHLYGSTGRSVCLSVGRLVTSALFTTVSKGSHAY
jgi:hypothetical protein